MINPAAQYEQAGLAEQLQYRAVPVPALETHRLPASESQSITPSGRATNPSSDTDMQRVSRRRGVASPIAQRSTR